MSETVYEDDEIRVTRSGDHYLTAPRYWPEDRLDILAEIILLLKGIDPCELSRMLNMRMELEKEGNDGERHQNQVDAIAQPDAKAARSR